MAFARRGRAPQDPRLAAAVVEWAEIYRRGQRDRLIRVFTAVLTVVSAAASAYFIVRGDVLAAVANLTVLSVNLLHIALTPVFRPENVDRALDASRRMAGLPSGGPGGRTAA